MPQSGAHGASPAGRGRGVRASPEPVEGPRGICGEDAAATGSGTLRNEGISPKGAHAMAACRACPAKLWRSRGGCAPLASRACLRTLPRIVIWNVLSRLQNRGIRRPLGGDQGKEVVVRSPEQAVGFRLPEVASIR